jgi:hypothetical protein
MLTGVVKFELEKFTVPFKEDKEEYEVFFRLLWDWATDLLDDPLLIPFFVWDAQCFFHEPWTANHMWDIQV